MAISNVYGHVMASYSVATTKDQLSALIERAQAGEDVVITKRGKAAARIVSATTPTRNRQAAMEILLKQIAELPPVNIPVERFYDWLYEDPTD